MPNRTCYQPEPADGGATGRRNLPLLCGLLALLTVVCGGCTLISAADAVGSTAIGVTKTTVKTTGRVAGGTIRATGKAAGAIVPDKQKE